tara:strand:- start:50 stop:418 length:369 start_codon:yes stop_codon:yes gene_type:complete
MDSFEKRIKTLLREFQGGDPLANLKKGNEEPKEKKTKDSSDLKAKHARVEGLLQNNVFNHAGVIERLWGDSEASNRSLFRKKLERELNDNGVPYEFDDEELSKIVNILMDTSKQITKTLSKK